MCRLSYIVLLSTFFFLTAFRNSSHSTLLAYRERSCLNSQISTSITDLWYDDYYKDYYRYNSERIHYDTHTPPNINTVDDHKIRIKVSCNDASSKQPSDDRADENQYIDVERVSGASVTIVEIGDTINTDTFELDNNSTCSSYVQTKNSRLIDNYDCNYNEKAIDVPEEFERNAYAIGGQTGCSPFVRNIQPSLQVRFLLIDSNCRSAL